STFDQIVAMTAFDGKGYAHLVRSDGTAVVRSSSPDALQTGYNILNSLAPARIRGERTLDEIKAEIANGKSGQVEFVLGDAREYMTYTPLENQRWSLLMFVPAGVVNTKSTMLLKITLMVCGSITGTFALLIGVLATTFLRNKHRLEQIAYVDPVTGGNTIERFYELARERLDSTGRSRYALVYTNVEKFKVLNEQFGRSACDEILCSLERGISMDLSADECMGRLFADNFCILMKDADEPAMADRFERWHRNGVLDMDARGTLWLPLIVEFGIYVIDNNAMPFPHMIDRAKLALGETVGELRGKIRYAIYDEQTRRQLFREKQLEDRMENALISQEFQMYLQPKYRTQTEKIG
ncbi:MAG: diguanylate cyclase, partial [Oscillospiraceae bacterium]